MKKLAFLAVIVLTFSILAACGGSSTPSSAPTKYGVQMGGVTFDVSTITVTKGSTITFTTESSGAAHNLVNGTEGHSSPESGAPSFGSGGQTVPSGKSWTSPPWNTAGTYHVTCTFHPTTMTMTVTVTG